MYSLMILYRSPCNLFVVTRQHQYPYTMITEKVGTDGKPTREGEEDAEFDIIGTEVHY